MRRNVAETHDWPDELGAEDLLEAGEQRLHQVREGRRTVIFRGDGHGAHDAVGKIGRARHEKEVFAGDSGILHFLLLVGCINVQGLGHAAPAFFTS